MREALKALGEDEEENQNAESEDAQMESEKLEYKKQDPSISEETKQQLEQVDAAAEDKEGKVFDNIGNKFSKANS